MPAHATSFNRRPEPEPSWGWWWLEAAGAAILVALPLLWMNLTPDRETHFHELLPMNSVYQGLLIDFVVVLLACALVFHLLQRWDPRCRTLVWIVVTALLVDRIGRTLVVAALLSPLADHSGWIFLAITVAGLLLWALRRPWYSGTMMGVRWALVLVGFSVFWVLPELVVMAFHREPHGFSGFTRPVAGRPQRRIIWLLFDEASWDQLFDHRQPGVDFPHFDALARTGVSFSDVQPEGYFTEKVIPSLLEGESITHERSDLDGRLSVRTQEHPHWELYPANRSLFADAQRLGWSTGLAGWYNPYCRTFAHELDHCFWTLSSPLPGRYAPDESALQNAVAPVKRSVLRLFGRHIHDLPLWQNHTQDYEAIMAHARAEIAGDQIGFLFVHLPVPHPGGMYNRRTHRIGADGSYLDNLVLTDLTLGELMNDINRSGMADRTTVIVSSDHSWRVNLWRSTPEWKPEDTVVSGGRFDPRPVLMVRFPGEATGETVRRPVPLLAMHNMIDQMLAGRIENSQQLAAWAAQQ
ncbi:MAG TPA: sulfatase-like hydrolase/transferase [Acidobacteriaceae bacterium]|nr:sulfatase-like hydrolase/transferase [Acidobacteriaceae bacterium]